MSLFCFVFGASLFAFVFGTCSKLVLSLARSAGVLHIFTAEVLTYEAQGLPSGPG